MYKTVGRYDEAIQLYSDVYSEYSRWLGEAHKNSLTVLHNLACAFKAKGEPDRAKPLFEHALQLMQDAPGTDKLQTLVMLAGCHRELNELEQAKRYLAEARTIAEAHYGPDSRQSANICSSMGLVLKANDEMEAAEQYLSK